MADTTDGEQAGRRLRPVRTFVRREGRLTDAQKRALDALYQRWGVSPPEGTLDLAALFGREASVVLEVGFGNGTALAEVARRHPERNYLGIEVHRPGVGRLLNEMERDGIDNIRVICHDAVEVMRDWLPPASLDAIQLYFPDPWPKKRHHKRRMVQPAWVELAARCLRPGGLLHMATDWEAYAAHMLEVMDSSSAFRNIHGAGRFAPDPGERPATHFEQRGLRKGHVVRDLMYRRMGVASTTAR